MSYLTNISVATADLVNEKGDIANYYLGSETDFSNQITEAKRIVHEDIKSEYAGLKPGYTDAELETDLGKLKDLPEGNVKRRVVLQAIAIIMRANEMLDMFREYSSYARSIPLKYYLDLDADSTVDDDEKLISKEVHIGR